VKVRYRHLVVLAGIIPVGAWLHYRNPEPTVLAFRIGQPFEEVVKHSSFPVMQHSITPEEDPMHLQAGETFVTEPAVILKFDDPKHGFTLPPTNFAVLGYMHNTVDTLATSPMLDKLPFEEAVAVLENLQNQFKAGGWEPYKGDDSEWFDLTPGGKKRLYARMFEPGYAQETTLRVPKKYGMTFRIKCAEGCWTREPPYKFLIDVGVGDDTEGWTPGDPNVWEKSHPAYQAPAGPEQPEFISGRTPGR
jgi:hypothetical protein